jgi:hypothetical protein
MLTGEIWTALRQEKLVASVTKTYRCHRTTEFQPKSVVLGLTVPATLGASADKVIE